MLKITDHQFDMLETTHERRLLDEAAVHLAAHPAAAPLGAAGQQALAADALAFWRAHDFIEDASFRALVELRLHPRYADPLPPLPAHYLTRPGFAERTRLAQARDALDHPQRRLIRLDSDLSQEFAA